MTRCDVAVLALFAASCNISFADETPNEVIKRIEVTAPVVYKDLMLVLKTSKGVAAIDFLEPIEKGVNYRFRFLATGGGMELSGKGKVFERYKIEDGAEVYDGGELFLTAGPIKLKWSLGGQDSGWIYYEPEKIQVQIASDNFFERYDPLPGRVFEKLDLGRIQNASP